MNAFVLSTASLVSRELKRFYRQRSRIVGSLLTPIIFWILLGTGLTAAFPNAGTEGKGFIEYFFLSNLLMTILFTAIFSTISIIEDRNTGFLQSVVVSPTSRFALVGGKVFGGALIGLFQGLLFYFLAPLAGVQLSLASFLLVLLPMFALGFAMTGLGFIFAWRINSVQGFHSIMNLFLFPMWLMSGAFFSVDNAPVWLQPVMYLNPLLYGFNALKLGTYPKLLSLQLPAYLVGLGICCLFGTVFFLLSAIEVNRNEVVNA